MMTASVCLGSFYAPKLRSNFDYLKPLYFYLFHTLFTGSTHSSFNHLKNSFSLSQAGGKNGSLANFALTDHVELPSLSFFSSHWTLSRNPSGVPTHPKSTQ